MNNYKYLRVVPAPPPPSPDPAVVYDDEGKPVFYGSFQDALAQSEKGETVKLNESQTLAYSLTVREGATLDLGGNALTCGNLTLGKDATLKTDGGALKTGTLTINEGATFIVPEGQTLINGTIIVYGTLIIDGVVITGEGVIIVYGEVVFEGESGVGDIEIVEAQPASAKNAKSENAPKIKIDASFKASGVTGILFLPGECYEVGFKVFDIEAGADKPNFRLGNAPDNLEGGRDIHPDRLRLPPPTPTKCSSGRATSPDLSMNKLERLIRHLASLDATFPRGEGFWAAS